MVDYFLLSRHIGVRYKEGVRSVGEVYEVCNRCTDDLVGMGCDRCSVGAGADLLCVGNWVGILECYQSDEDGMTAVEFRVKCFREKNRDTVGNFSIG